MFFYKINGFNGAVLSYKRLTQLSKVFHTNLPNSYCDQIQLMPSHTLCLFSIA